MRVLFKQAVNLDGKDYSRGPHLISESVSKNVFYQKFVKAGLIVEEEKEVDKVVTFETPFERNERLMNSFSPQKAEVPKEMAGPFPIMSEDDEIEAEPEEMEAIEQKERPKNKTKKKR